MRIPMPTLSEGSTVIRPIAVRDAKALEQELALNRGWLRRWEATNPDGFGAFDTKAGIRALLEQSRDGHGAPFALEVDGEFAGQLNVSQMFFGSLSSCAIGYWVAQRFAGRGVMPTAVALAADFCFLRLGLHRVEICIRPENAPSLRVVEKLGFRYEGLRRKYIHIDGGWRDHFAFALTIEDAPLGVLRRWQIGEADPGLARVPEADRLAAGMPGVAPGKP